MLLWDFTNQNTLRTDALEQACSITRRGLTPDEWAAYVSGLPYANACARCTRLKHRVDLGSVVLQR